MSLLNVIPGSTLAATQEQAAIEQAQFEDEAAGKQEDVLSGLASYIKTRWDQAKSAKREVEQQMLKNLRQRKGEYEAAKLAAIRKMGSAENFILLTDTKCRSGLAWIKDVLFQPGMRPWSIEPTPEPELPPELEKAVITQFMSGLIQDMAQQQMMAGVIPDMGGIMAELSGMAPELKAQLRKAFYRKAKERSVEMERKLDDQLTEGGWYTSLESCLDDLVTLKACVLKGPIIRQERRRTKHFDPSSGKSTTTFETKLIPTFESRSPFDIYPEPDATGVDDGYLFDRLKLTRKQLYDLIGLPGFNEVSIRKVLDEFSDGKLVEWTGIETERASAEGKDTNAVNLSERVDCLEFWGFIPGKLLIEWGMTDLEVPDPDGSYSVCTWMIGGNVIKAMLNPDELGVKPFSVTSYEKIKGAFWGNGVPELIADCQGICNAIVRAMVNNAGIASGPQIEVNKQRFPAGYPMGLWPWKVWESTDIGLSTAPALKVYNIPLNADKLVMLYNHFSKIADEESGIPAYSHGDSQVGGAGNTASGLSMLMTHAARGIKNVIRAIDTDLIGPSIERTYNMNMDMEESEDFIFDMRIVARGSSSLIAKEQQAVRLTEFSNVTNNPVDLQIMGMEGRRDLLIQAAKANEIDIENIFPDDPLENLQLPMMSQDGGGPVPGQIEGPKALDAAGNPAQGEDTRLVPQDQAPQMRSTV